MPATIIAMRGYLVLGLMVALVNDCLAARPSHHSHIPMVENTTCPTIYGEGSITCGDATRKSCYAPNLGQTCCTLDFGFCEIGTFCAPVSGWCCNDGEDPVTCATISSGIKARNLTKSSFPQFLGILTAIPPSPSSTGPATSAISFLTITRSSFTTLVLNFSKSAFTEASTTLLKTTVSTTPTAPFALSNVTGLVQAKHFTSTLHVTSVAILTLAGTDIATTTRSTSTATVTSTTRVTRANIKPTSGISSSIPALTDTKAVSSAPTPTRNPTSGFLTSAAERGSEVEAGAISGVLCLAVVVFSVL